MFWSSRKCAAHHRRPAKAVRRRRTTYVPREANARWPERGLRYQTRVSDACGSARSNQVERMRQGKPRLPVSVGEQRPRDAMVTDASHRATACFLIGQVRCKNAPDPNATNSRNGCSRYRKRYPNYKRATQTLLMTPTRRRRTCAVDGRQITTYLLVPPSLTATGSQEISPVLGNKCCRFTTAITLPVSPSLAATGSRAIQPVSRALDPSRGCDYGHQAG